MRCRCFQSRREDTLNAVTAAITQLCDSHHDRKQRWRAMKSVKWVLVSNTGLYAGLEDLRCVLVDDIDKAQVFDGRDNEMQKALFYSALLKVPVQPVLLACAS